MKNNQSLPLRGQRRGASLAPFALLSSIALCTSTTAEDPPDAPEELDKLVVSALRIPTSVNDNPASVGIINPRDTEAQGIYLLRDALNRVPGVISTSTSGQTGAIGSLFIRGTGTSYSQVVVDGMRITDSNAPLGNFLGNARTSGFGRIEVLRGPHGALYGGESVGGVLWLETASGSREPITQIRGEVGSFNSYSLNAQHSGSEGRLTYFLSGGYEETSNDTSPDQDHRLWRTALRADIDLDDTWDLRLTFRGNDSFFRDSNPSDNRVDSVLTTLQATGKISNRWTSRFHTGYYREDYQNIGAFGPFETELRTLNFSTNQEIQLTDDLLLLAGGFISEDDFANTIGVDQTRERYGAHASLQWQPIDGLTLLQSGRWEDYDAFGDEFTWRSSAAYHFDEHGLTIRGGYGKSFRTPTYLDLFGSFFGAGNPTLDPESARGWDLGFAKSLGPNHEIEVTYFHNRISNQIQSFPTPPQNIPGATDTQGLEIGARGAWFDQRLHYHLAWTWTDESLVDLPRNAVNASLDWDATDKTRVGVGVNHLSSRSFGGTPIAAATITRLHASHQLTENLRLHARIENLLDEDYELSNFFGNVIQGPGTGFYLGLTATW